MVLGCTGYDDPENWHWCDVGDFYWYSQSLDYHVDNVADAETYDYFITSITCTGEYSLFAQQASLASFLDKNQLYSNEITKLCEFIA